MGDRAERRRHRERMLARARRLYPDDPRPQQYADNRTPCSCPVCGNPRRHFGQRTRQEILADDYSIIP